MVIVENKETGKQRTLHFGATGYEQFKDRTKVGYYTRKNHGDKKRQENYYNRHSGERNRKKAIKKEKNTLMYTYSIITVNIITILYVYINIIFLNGFVVLKK